jgi:hypothetical protein
MKSFLAFQSKSPPEGLKEAETLTQHDVFWNPFGAEPPYRLVRFLLSDLFFLSQNFSSMLSVV